MGAISGGIVGGIVLVFLIATFFLLRRRQRVVNQPQPQPLPEISSTARPIELPASMLIELQLDTERIELPAAPVDLDGSLPRTDAVNSTALVKQQ